MACPEKPIVQAMHSKDNRVPRGDKGVWKRGVYKCVYQEIVRLLIVRLDLERSERESEVEYEGHIRPPSCTSRRLLLQY